MTAQEEKKIRDGVAEVVNAIYRRDGCVQTHTLVEEARDPLSPAHRGFEWDDVKAAEAHRLQQARKWLREVTIVIEEREERLYNVQIVHQPEKYIPLTDVVSDVDNYEYALRTARTYLRSAQNYVRELEQAVENMDKKKHARAKRASSHIEKAQKALG